MNQGKSPFVPKKLPCPVCNQEAENRYFLPKVFIEKGKESDSHVAEYKWLDSAFESIHPPWYHFWHCQSCKWTASQKDFTKPTADRENNFSTLRQSFQKINPGQKQLVQMLGGDDNYDKMNFDMALRMHLLAIFIQELAPDDYRDSSKLGSYYLRTGWLFREQAAREDGQAELERATAFLDKICKLWTTLPKDEAHCLKTAASYFEIAYQRHPRYADMVAATELMILIAGLYMRSDDVPKAMQCVNTVMNAGMKFRAKQAELVRREQETGNLSMARKAQIDAASSRINSLMEKAGDIRQVIVNKKIEEQTPKAKQIVQKMEAAEHETEAIREKLKEMDFEPALITKLLGEPKRKKFLGLF
ncbi:MAG: DUF2225 domain-containing protein [Gemmatimonadota bacterium]|nr:DUF2225 domain-containing protein [Gemmatimonadota bacterium]